MGLSEGGQAVHHANPAEEAIPGWGGLLALVLFTLCRGIFKCLLVGCFWMPRPGFTRRKP